MSEELKNEVLEETTEEVVTRLHPLTVISLIVYGEYEVHDIQQNTSWLSNPYENYAVVPDEMVEEIMETRGFCDIELNEEGTEVVSFTAREIPDIPEPEPTPTEEDVWAELDKAYQEGVNSI